MGRWGHRPRSLVGGALACILFAGCEDGRKPDADTSFDAAIDASADARAADASTTDAGPGDCGGRDRLEVVTTKIDGTPDVGVNVYLRCGAITVYWATGSDGHVTFDGLDLANQPVDVTAWSYAMGWPVETYLDVDESSGGRLDITIQTDNTSGSRPVRGTIERSEPGSVAMVWMPFTASISDAPTYSMFPFDLDPLRLTAIEYRVEDDGVVPLSFFDRSFPPPPFEELPNVTFEPGATFATASVEILVEDARLFDRWVPGLSSDFEIRLPVLVIDRDPSDIRDYGLHAHVIGITTRNDHTDDADRVEVAWSPQVQGWPLTQLQAVDATFRVWSVARYGATPDTLGSVVMPAPPGLSGITPDILTDLDGLEVTLERPEWLGDGEAFVEVNADFGWGPLLRWRVHPGRGRDTVRFPPVEGYGTADMIAASWLGQPTRISLAVVARNGVEPNDGPALFGEDGRFPVDVH